jgi:hypothetical protein
MLCAVTCTAENVASSSRKPLGFLHCAERPQTAHSHPTSRMCRLGFGFSAGGLMFPYFVGIASALCDIGVIIPGKTHLSGASAGSVIAACVNCGMSTDDIMRAMLQLGAELRSEGGGAYRRLGPCVHRVLEEYLPVDAHVRNTGITHIAVTRALPCAPPPPPPPCASTLVFGASNIRRSFVLPTFCHFQACASNPASPDIALHCDENMYNVLDTLLRRCVSDNRIADSAMLSTKTFCTVVYW